RDAWFAQWAAWFVEQRCRLAGDTACAEALAFLVAVDGRGYTPRLAAFEQIKQRFPALEPAARELLQEFYDHQAEAVSLDPGARVLIDALVQARMPFGIVSNGSDNQLRK